jgi:NAD-dependent SIR2 family protein deacetylase
MIEKQTTKHCPICDSEELRCRIDIFNEVEYDEFSCFNKHEFKEKDIIIKVWVSLESLKKEIELIKEVIKQMEDANYMTYEGSDIINKKLDSLCNSQEQKDADNN